MNFLKATISIMIISATALGSITNEEREQLTCVQMTMLNQVLTMFKFDNKTYPTTEEGLSALIKNPNPKKYPNYFQSGYFHDGKEPKDIWQNTFNYKLSANRVDLFSSGSDGIVGNSDDIPFSSCRSILQRSKSK